MERIHIRFLLIMTCASLLAMTGGKASTRNLDTEAETHYDATDDFSDKSQIVNRLVPPLLSAPVFPVQEKPILIVYPVVNETSEHISTGGITDEIRLRLIQSGRFRFISEDQRENIQKEADYQYQGNGDPAMRVA